MQTSTIVKVLILLFIFELLLECSGKAVKNVSKKKNDLTKKKLGIRKDKTKFKKETKKKETLKNKEKSDEENPLAKFAVKATKKVAKEVAGAVGSSIALAAGGLPMLAAYEVTKFGIEHKDLVKKSAQQIGKIMRRKTV
ncbi:hypothetical protein ACQ4LE_007820 [Meloidogyne hapla]|uniref:Uncharacterized protein n=1 Tax=Meloidogyne hapla TaxID=6305 RepID=A0A1I8BYC9_MELHA